MAQSMTKPLPDGWEKRASPTDQVYFINHKIKKSTWIAPPGCDIGVNWFFFLSFSSFFFFFFFGLLLFVCNKRRRKGKVKIVLEENNEGKR